MATAMHPHPSQYVPALERANEVRICRAQVCHDLRRGKRALADVLEHEAVATMQLVELLKRQHKYGNARAQKVCAMTEISPSRLVGALTERQRAHIVLCCS